MKKQKIFRFLLIGLGAAVGFFLLFRVALPLFLPLVLAFSLAFSVRRPARLLAEKAGLKFPLASGLCILTVYAIFLAICFLLCRTLFRELGALMGHLPALLQGLSGPLEQLRSSLLSLTGRFPDGIGTALTELVDEFFRGGTGLVKALPGRLLSLVTAAARSLPRTVLLTVTTVVASFLAAGETERLLAFSRQHLPPVWQARLGNIFRRCRRAVGGWLKAEIKLGGVTFLLAAFGLMLLGADYPFLFGLLIAFIDLLPVFGSGAVLIPWALGLYLQGFTGRGTAFLVLYGIIAGTRATLEPRFLGKQMGTSPLLTLGAVYAGAKVAGFWGLLLFPLTVSVGLQVWKLGRLPPPGTE